MNEHELNQENARLRALLLRTGKHLALLSDVNRQLTGASSLDEILDAVPLVPQRLVAAHAVALVLLDDERTVVARTSGSIEHRRIAQTVSADTLVSSEPRVIDDILVLPLHDGQSLLGWIEVFRVATEPLPEDERALLETIAGEIAEAISGARRRVQQAVAMYELERAISEERARIARDIHDGIAQTLAFRRMRIDLWLDWITVDPELLREEMLQLKQILRDQIADLRRAIFALRPIQFDELGFATALQRYVVEFAEQQGWQVDVDVDDLPSDLDFAAEAAAFRVVQEALTNAAKHAAATAIVVTLHHRSNRLLVSVRDNGRGYDTLSRPEDQPGHYGLRQMRERLLAIGGRLVIQSHLEAGTTVQAIIPVQPGRSQITSQ